MNNEIIYFIQDTAVVLLAALCTFVLVGIIYGIEYLIEKLKKGGTKNG